MIRITKEQSLNYRRLDLEKDFTYNMSSAIAFTLESFDEEWELVTYYGEAFTDPTGSTTKPHWIYVMVNPLIRDVCKIGFTTTSVEQRARELTAQTASIKPWYVVFSYKCPNGRMLETEIHKYLEDRGIRVNHKREGFYITSAEAISVIKDIGAKYQTT